MKKIKIGFSKNYYDRNEVLDLLTQKFNVKVLSENYDYLFCDDLIYRFKDDFNKLLLENPNTIRIFFTGEAVYPDLNLFDYARCFDDFNNERTFKFITSKFEEDKLYDSEKRIDETKKINLQNILSSKTKFCNFIYGNSWAHPMRDKLFYEISKYKKVDSLGRHLNNVDIQNTRNCGNWRTISIDLKRPYKFSIAAENAQFKGYTTEKIITSMIANTIPIYFGDPDINKLFNPKSFINVDNYSNMDDLVKRIKEIDKNDDLYLEILSEPWRTEEQIEYCEKEYQNYLNKFYHIFEQDFKNAHRRPQGCWPDILYPNAFKNNKIEKKVSYSALENIFSVKNSIDRRHKILRIMGISIKFRRKDINNEIV